jgi:membrane associated rhomboid family serine protease
MAGSTALHVLTTQPVTVALVLFMSLLFFVMWNRRMTYEAVAVSYRQVVEQGQLYRVFTAAACHLDAMHILFNMGSLLSVGALETAFGSAWYLETTALLLLCCSALWLLSLHVAATRFGRREWLDSSAVGYSGVIFGWFTVAGLLQPGASAWGLPITVAPFVSLVFTQLIVRRASFLGHLAGILAGYVAGWGLLEWARGYWLAVAMAAMAAAALLSARASPAFGPWLARVLVLSPAALEDLGGTGDGGGGAAIAPQQHSRIEASGVVRVWHAVRPEDIRVSPVPLPPSVFASVAGEPRPQPTAEAPQQQQQLQWLRSQPPVSGRDSERDALV